MARAKNKVDEARAEILSTMDRLTAPDEMSKSEALECLEELFADLEGRCEALKHEIEEDGES